MATVQDRVLLNEYLNRGDVSNSKSTAEASSLDNPCTEMVSRKMKKAVKALKSMKKDRLLSNETVLETRARPGLNIKIRSFIGNAGKITGKSASKSNNSGSTVDNSNDTSMSTSSGLKSTDSTSDAAQKSLFTIDNVLAKGKMERGEHMNNFMSRLFEIPTAIKKAALDINPMSKVKMTRNIGGGMKPMTITAKIVRCSKYSVRNSQFISRTGEWSGTMLIPYDPVFNNSVMMAYMYVDTTPVLTVFAVVENHVKNMVDGYVQVSFQLIEEDGGSMPFPDAQLDSSKDDIRITVRIVTKVRNISKSNFLKMRNPDDTWNSQAVNTLIDLMQSDRRESLVRSYYVDEFNLKTAHKAVMAEIEAGEYEKLHVYFNGENNAEESDFEEEEESSFSDSDSESEYQE